MLSYIKQVFEVHGSMVNILTNVNILTYVNILRYVFDEFITTLNM